MPIVKVRQGQSVNNIAFENGFAWKTIWDLPENSDLKQLRGDAGVLLPGDEIFIPEKEDKQEQRGAEAKHSFKLPDIPFRIALVLRRPDKSAIEGVQWELIVDGNVIKSGKTTADGRIESSVPPKARHAILTLNGRRHRIRLRHLDPANTLSGCRQRLRNLGYEPERGRGAFSDKDRTALSQFQADHELEQSGAMDAATIEKLRLFHEDVELSGKPNETEQAMPQPLRVTGTGASEHASIQIPDIDVADDAASDIPEDTEGYQRTEDEAKAGNDPGRPMTMKCVQSILKSLEYRPGPVDGILGPRTRRALRRFQSANAVEHGLITSGEADSATLAALRKELARG